MTQAEFAQGWKILILQPWGFRYRQLTPDGQPTEEAKLQMQFYYDKLKWAHPGAWLKAAQQYAAGDEWPTLANLTTTLKAVQPDFVLPLPMPTGACLTLDEFGVDLYECIKLFAQRALVRQHYKRMVTNLNVPAPERKVKLAALTATEDVLTTKILELIPKLQPDDVKRLLAKYETKGAA